MKKLSGVSLLDIMPESILLDPKLKASAQALTSQLQTVTNAIREVLHLPRLDELSGDVLDYLMEQFHIDFAEPLYMTEDIKKDLIRDSIAWHRIKGTPAAVEKIAEIAFTRAEVLEWFDYYGGKPYHFKIRSHGFRQTPEDWSVYLRMIYAAKNVRSWLDDLELVLDETDLGFNSAHAAIVRTTIGDATISIAKPKQFYESTSFAGMAGLVSGEVTESLARPNLKFSVPANVGMVLKKVGSIRINSETKSPDPGSYFAKSWTSQVQTGNAELKTGNVTIKDDSAFRTRHKSKVRVGSALMVTGNVIIGSSDPPRVPDAREGDFVFLDKNGAPFDSGCRVASDAQIDEMLEIVFGKQNPRVPGAKRGNLVAVKPSGTLADSNFGIATDKQIADMLDEIFGPQI